MATRCNMLTNERWKLCAGAKEHTGSQNAWRDNNEWRHVAVRTNSPMSDGSFAVVQRSTRGIEKRRKKNNKWEHVEVSTNSPMSDGSFAVVQRSTRGVKTRGRTTPNGDKHTNE